MLKALLRIIRAGWLNFRRQSGLSFATCFIMFLTISLVTSLFLFYEIAQFLIAEVQKKVDISVYFKEDTREEEILKIKEEVAGLPEVRSVEYISNKEAIESLLERHPELAESVRETEGMLNLSSLKIKTAQAFQYAAVTQFLENGYFKDFIKKIDYYQRKPVIDKIFSVTETISQLGILFALLLVFVAVSVTFNQIRLAIYSSREEISIQRLVGASNYFIRAPFLVQGALSGLFAAIFTLLIFAGSLYFLSFKTQVLFAGFNVFHYFTANFWTIVLLQLIFGIGLGVISGLIAIRKYLKI